MTQTHAAFLGLVFSFIAIWLIGLNLATSLIIEMNRVRRFTSKLLCFATLVIIIALCIASTSVIAEFFGFGGIIL